MSSTDSTKMSTKRIVIKPLSPNEVNLDHVNFSSVRNNTEMKSKWVDMTYSRGDIDSVSASSNKDKLLVKASGCVIKTFKKVEFTNKDGSKVEEKTAGDKSKPRRDKYTVFMSVKDETFIEFIKNFESHLIKVGAENSKAWLDKDYTDEDTKDMIKPTFAVNPKYPVEKYGYSMGSGLSHDFLCKSKTDLVPNVSDLNVALVKNNIIDVCFYFNRVKLGSGEYRLGMEIAQINIVGVSEDSSSGKGLTPEEFESGKITLTEQEKHEKGGKFCKIKYDNQALRIHLDNVVGRIFRFDKEGISYNLSIRLTDPRFRKMIEGINAETFKILVDKSTEYFGKKQTAKILSAKVKSIVSYNKADQEKIDKGEKPTYDPSVWIKIYYSAEKGVDGKIINADTGKPIQNIDDIINKDITISSLDFYSRHIWFGPKGTSVNFTVGKCAITYETTEYDMDAVESDEDEEEDDNDNFAEQEEAKNSDDE